MAQKFVKLTRPNMRKLEPGKHLMEHGIRFERMASGDGRFTVNIMVDGERVHRVIGKESEGVTRKQAEDFIQQARTDARKGRLNLPTGRKVALGFENAAEEYLVKLEQEGGKNLKEKRRQLHQQLIPFFKSKALSKITATDIELFKQRRLEDGRAKGSINRELAVLSHLFTKAVDWNWIEHRPAAIKRFKEENRRITYLTTEQIARLLEAAKTDQNAVIYPFIVIGVETSMRRMEILSIRLEHIDLDRRVIYIPKAKAGAREQPITAHLAAFLRGYVDSANVGQEWLFPANSKTGHTLWIESSFRRVVAKAGLNPKEVNRHTLRHTAISHLVQAGVDLPTVARIPGHNTLSMVARYAHQNGEHIQSAMDRLEQRYQTGG
ncbi:tyrosine-type recombinase/integrase [Magnetofaba australis]|uniref:Putative integrase family protein n=1 Tax=Magnetofaba australis IT-1 TaxID=1434232 RepID=A0A1Y2K2I4_9PROT|nr:site-specific integrase [Magnetofaba australis]OSM01796.1 putative integrase family protein [Magnetofaba australis IT-1]